MPAPDSPGEAREREAPARLPSSARRVVDAVREGAAGAMFPPVVCAGPEGTVAVDRLLGGEADARMLERALHDGRFSPLLELWERLDDWCAHSAPRYSGVVSAGILDITNADVFGPTVSEAFVACAAESRVTPVSGWPSGERAARNS